MWFEHRLPYWFCGRNQSACWLRPWPAKTTLFWSAPWVTLNTPHACDAVGHWCVTCVSVSAWSTSVECRSRWLSARTSVSSICQVGRTSCQLQCQHKTCRVKDPADSGATQKQCDYFARPPPKRNKLDTSARGARNLENVGVHNFRTRKFSFFVFFLPNFVNQN